MASTGVVRDTAGRVAGYPKKSGWLLGYSAKTECRAEENPPTMSMRALFLIVVLMLSAGSAAAKNCFVFEDNQSITVRGHVVQSTMMAENSEEGKPYKFMAIVLDSALCFKNDPDETIRLIGANPVSRRWLGHHVSATGKMTASGDGWYLSVRQIAVSPVMAANKVTCEGTLEHGSGGEYIGLKPQCWLGSVEEVVLAVCKLFEHCKITGVATTCENNHDRHLCLEIIKLNSISR